MKFFLIGQPNVGKSSIYNILTGSNNNIVHKEEGTTRDWHSDFIKGSNSKIFDTPGIIIGEPKTPHSYDFGIFGRVQTLPNQLFLSLENPRIPNNNSRKTWNLFLNIFRNLRMLETPYVDKFGKFARRTMRKIR